MKICVGFCWVEVLLTPLEGSPKSQFQPVMLPADAGMPDDVLLKLTAPFSQATGSKLNLAEAVSNTVMDLVMVSIQPAALEVNVYLILNVPMPAATGSKIPEEETPGPVNTPVPGTPPVSLACVIWNGAAS